MKEPDRHQLPSRPGRKRSTRAPGAVSRIDQVRENQSIDCRARAQWERATARTTAAVVHACASRSPGRPGTVRIDGRPRAWIAIAAAGLGRQSPEVGAGRSTDHVRTCAGDARRPTSEPGQGAERCGARAYLASESVLLPKTCQMPPWALKRYRSKCLPAR